MAQESPKATGRPVAHGQNKVMAVDAWTVLSTKCWVQLADGRLADASCGHGEWKEEKKEITQVRLPKKKRGEGETKDLAVGKKRRLEMPAASPFFFFAAIHVFPPP